MEDEKVSQLLLFKCFGENVKLPEKRKKIAKNQRRRKRLSPSTKIVVNLCLLDFERPMVARVQILAMKNILSLLLQRKRNTEDEIVKSLAEKGFSKEDSENALRELIERSIICEDYGRQKKWYGLRVV